MILHWIFDQKKNSIKDNIETIGEIVLYSCLVFLNLIVPCFMQENVIFLRKHTLEYFGVKGHDI